jgi:hypothetical protein
MQVRAKRLTSLVLLLSVHHHENFRMHRDLACTSAEQLP